MGMEIIPIPWLRPAQSQTALGGTDSFLKTCWFQLPTSFSSFLGLSAGPGEPGPVTPTGGLRLQVVTPAEQWGEVWPPSPCGGCSGRGGGSQPVRAAYTEGRHGGQAQGKWTTQESGQVCELEGSMSPGPSTTPISMAVSSCGACGLEATLSGTRQGWGERPCSTGAWSKGFQVAGPGGPLPSAPRGLPRVDHPLYRDQDHSSFPGLGRAIGAQQCQERSKGHQSQAPSSHTEVVWTTGDSLVLERETEGQTGWCGAPFGCPRRDRKSDCLGSHPGFLLLYQVWALTSVSSLSWASP